MYVSVSTCAFYTLTYIHVHRYMRDHKKNVTLNKVVNNYKILGHEQNVGMYAFSGGGGGVVLRLTS